jgi:dimethylamine monooxygenase subunit C
MRTAIFVSGKRKYLFCGTQEGMKQLFAVIERVKEEGHPYEIVVIDDIQESLQLSDFLKKQKMGTYLYVALSHTELKRVEKTAEEAGFTEEETQFIGYGEELKRIFCCRCHGINEAKNFEREILCNQCGLELSVSDHYSVYHNAVLGYVAKL